MRHRHHDSLAFTVVVTILVVLCAVPVAVVVALSGAPGTMLLAILLAALPVGPLVASYLWLDRYEPEPRWLLAAGLLWGGAVATVGSVLLGGLGGLVVGVSEATALVVLAPVSEELTKGAFLVLLVWWRRHEVDGLLDGLVYAGMVGIGFAFVENILYLAAAYDGAEGFGPGGAAAVTTTFVMRALISPFAHPLFTAFIGIGVGIAVGSRKVGVRFLAPVAGYVLAVIAHALWNGATLTGGAGFLGVYVAIMLPAFVVLATVAVWLRSREREMLHAALLDASRRGLVPASDIPHLVGLRARRNARAWAFRQGGREARRRVSDYQQAAIELGFLHHRYLRGTPPRDFRPRGRAHVERMRAIRPHIDFPGQVVPTR